MIAKKNICWLLPAVAVALILAWTAAALRGKTVPAATEEIVLVAKDVAFRLADHPDEPNPPLQLTRGRPVKLIVRNEEPGKVLHCFTIGGLDVATTRNLATGESESLSFTPAESGTFAYACLMHSTMTGKVIVN